MMELTTYTELEIAHRLMTSYAQKCRSLHGHRYEVEITVTAQKFNEDGMIVDFKKLKEVVKTVLDDKWDHGSCFNANDPLAKAVDASGSSRVHIINANPTLEWMVEHWALELQKALDNFCPGVAVSMLKASETARNTVTWRCNCLPWERSESVDGAKKPVCADKEKERLDDKAQPFARENDCASPGATVKVGTSLPTDEIEEGIAGVEEEHWSPDAVPYLVAYSDSLRMYSSVVYSSLTGEELVEYCQDAVTKVGDLCGPVVVLGISRLPG